MKPLARKFDCKCKKILPNVPYHIKFKKHVFMFYNFRFLGKDKKNLNIYFIPFHIVSHSFEDIILDLYYSHYTNSGNLL